MFVAGKTFLILSALLLLNLMFAVVAESEIIKDIGGKRYYISVGQKLKWLDASHTCTSMGMSLASIESKTEYTNLRHYLLSQDDLVYEGFWLSGSNFADTNFADFTWLSSGNKLNYAEWAKEKTTPSSVECIYTDTKFQWNSKSCTSTANFICSRPLVPKCGITGRCKITPGFF